MSQLKATRWILTSAAATGLMIGSVHAFAQESTNPIDALVTARLVADAPQTHATNLSEFWIGIDGTPADETIRAQLELAGGHGVVVSQVVENSPAAKAGLERFDVLFAAGSKPLGDIADLAAIISEEKDKPLLLRVVRKSKQIVVEVRPERRPASQTGETCPQISRIDDTQFISRVFLDLIGLPPTENDVKQFLHDSHAEKRAQLTLRLLRQTNQQGKSCITCHRPQDEQDGARLLIQWLNEKSAPYLAHRFRNRLGVDQSAWAQALLRQNESNRLTLAFPAVLDVSGSVELPDDLTIAVTRQGKQPVRVRVTKSEESWETTSDKLDQLPDSVRPYVEQMLGVQRNPAINFFEYRTLITNPTVDSPQAQQPAEAPSGANQPHNLNTTPNTPSSAIDRLDQQLEKFRRDLDELRRSIQDLRVREEVKGDR